MVRADNDKVEPVAAPAQKASARILSSVVPWLTIRSLVVALVLQVLGFILGAPAGTVLAMLGGVLALLGLGVSAAVTGRSLAWSLLAALPVVGPVIGYIVFRRQAPVPDATISVPVKALRTAVHILVLVALLWASGTWQYKKEIREIRGETPDGFPMLAVVRAEGGTGISAWVVQKRDLMQFSREYPGFSWLVPQGAEKSLSEGLRYYNVSGEFKDMDINPHGYFKMSRLGEDRQRFEVRYPIHTEAHITGWYDATTRNIEPKRYRVYHDFASGVAWMLVFFLVVGIYLPLAWLFNRYLWPRLCALIGHRR